MRYFLIILICCLVGVANAHECKLDKIETKYAQIHEGPPNASVLGGYVFIINNNYKEITLKRVFSNFSAKSELHFMEVKNGVMKMRKFNNGIKISPKSTLKLIPGGMHIMFIGLKHKIKVGEIYNIEMEFMNCGILKTSFKVLKKSR